MRLYKIVKDVEFPEKTEAGYINIRSIERIDVRPNETRYVRTGLRATKTKNEILVVESAWEDVEEVKESGVMCDDS